MEFLDLISLKCHHCWYLGNFLILSLALIVYHKKRLSDCGTQETILCLSVSVQRAQILVGRLSRTQTPQTFHHTITLFINLPIQRLYSPGRSLICLSVSTMPHKNSLQTCVPLVFMPIFAALDIIAQSKSCHMMDQRQSILFGKKNTPLIIFSVFSQCQCTVIRCEDRVS